MSDNKKTGFGRYGKGYYIALVLCAAAIGITSYVYYRNTEDTLRDPEVLEASANREDLGGDIPVLATVPKQTKPLNPGTEATAPARTTLQTTFPVEGQEVFGYSMEVLSYNRTTRDWRTHDGVDIAAEAGTEVVAAADGEVYATFEDETLGCTVVIRHEGGYTTCYSSLSQDLRVKAGDKVAMGDVLGTVGTTALVETVLGPHVHFSVTYQDAPMDPAEFFSLG
jgi:murein DD-endopeptidase MepM/ murein hydrolase activator NlpD